MGRPLISVYRVFLIILTLKWLEIGIFVNCEIFTAQVELESLFELRKTVSDGINKYLDREELRLQEVRNALLQSSGLSRIDCSTNSNKKADPTNPINAFLVIKGLSMDLANTLLPALDKSNIKELSELMSNLNENKRFPDHRDLKGAVDGLTRLQETYRLSIKSLSKGCLYDNVCTTDLTADDCFELGRQNFELRSYNKSISWMKEALAKFEVAETLRSFFNHSEVSNSYRGNVNAEDLKKKSPLKIPATIRKHEILEYISVAEEIETTLNFGRKFLSEMTGHTLASFVDEVVKVMQGEEVTGTEEQDSYETSLKTYEALCRGEYGEFSSVNPALKCSYSSRGHPFYMIGPIKEEVVSLEPMIWKFHKVLYDQEIEIIKELAKPDFKTATVINTITGATEHSTARVSKSAWLNDTHHPVVEQVNKRIGLLTGLNMETAEELQIANYGLGGMYLPHYDFAHTKATTESFDSEENRISTLMFYLSNVEAGGATVFPSLKLSIWPEKGSAIFWYNLKSDGSGDLRTRHAACPVLMGSKWVSNKWITDRGQEFLRPCDLHSD